MQYLFLAAVLGILGSLPLVVFAAVRNKLYLWLPEGF